MPTLTEALNAGLAFIRADKAASSVVVTGVAAGSKLVYTFEIYRDENIRLISAVPA